MKNILFAIILLAFCGFIFVDPMTIKPGEGIGQLYLNKSTLKEIRSVLGKQKLQKSEWKAPHCGMTYKEKVLNYKDKGILFNFYNSESPQDTDRIVSIVLYGKCNATTDKEIKVNFSKRKDIYEAYGQPNPKQDTTTWLEYLDLGITFEFDYWEKNTVKRIYIYSPKKTD